MKAKSVMTQNHNIVQYPHVSGYINTVIKIIHSNVHTFHHSVMVKYLQYGC